jgi:hypothetical protein
MAEHDHDRYTLAEAAAELVRRECLYWGHCYHVSEYSQGGERWPIVVQCMRCGADWKVAGR